MYRYAAGKVDWVSAGLPTEGELAGELRLSDIVKRDVATCRLGQRVGDVVARDDLCVVINDARIVLGDLRGKALHADPNALVDDVMNPGPSTYRPNTPVQEMAHHLIESGGRRVLVSDGDGQLIGMTTFGDVLTALDSARQRA